MAHPMVQVKPSRRQRDMSPVHPNAAAIDIGAKMHVAVRTGIPVRTFNTFTDDLHRLADWFEQCGSRRSSWNPPGSIGFQSTRSWNNVGSRCRWSMPGMPGTFLGASQ